VRTVTPTYICSVIIQVIVTAVKNKQPLKKGIKGEKERRKFEVQNDFSPL